MLRTRVIPCLLLKDGGLVKTVRFKRPRYVGDPINAVKILNDKYVDEIVLFDITASRERRPPAFRLIEKIISEAFMPFCYGGGVTGLEDAQRLFELGVEKVAVNTAARVDPGLITALAERFGSQSVVVGFDVKRDLLGRPRLIAHAGGVRLQESPAEFARRVEALGAGELFVNSVDRDGTMAGYDLPVIQAIATAVEIPVIACGGAGSLDDMAGAVAGTGVPAVAAGSLFVYRGRHRAVLINYPSQEELEGLFP
jgi:cyclase